MPVSGRASVPNVRERILAHRDELDEYLTECSLVDDLVEDAGALRLLDDLVGATETLVAARSERDRAPHLTAAQRQQVKLIAHHATSLGEACGPDTTAAARLVGNWAVLEDLGGLSLVQLLRGVWALAEEAQYRLQEEPPAPRHRPIDEPFRFFIDAVVRALTRAGEPVRSSRTGNTAAVLKILLRATGQPAPANLALHLRRAIAESQRSGPDPFAEFDKKPRSVR